MYDAVGMATGAEYSSSRPPNIDHYFHALKTDWAIIYPSNKADDPNNREIDRLDGSPSTHGDIGGATDAEYTLAHSMMINWAKNSGVRIDNRNITREYFLIKRNRRDEI